MSDGYSNILRQNSTLPLTKEAMMPPDQRELGRRLRAAREASRLTQEAVAHRLGVSRSTVAQMELGNRAVTSLELDRLATLYARDIRDLLTDDFQ